MAGCLLLNGSPRTLRGSEAPNVDPAFLATPPIQAIPREAALLKPSLKETTLRMTGASVHVATAPPDVEITPRRMAEFAGT